MAYSNYNILLITFLFNLLVIFIFSMIYGNIGTNNFQHLKVDKSLNYIDYLFYSITIQCGVGLPDITAITDKAKILASLQQIILMGTAFTVASLILS